MSTLFHCHGLPGDVVRLIWDIETQHNNGAGEEEIAAATDKLFQLAQERGIDLANCESFQDGMDTHTLLPKRPIQNHQTISRLERELTAV
jgi:hypothetical protein